MADVFHGQLGPGIASGVHVIHDWVVGSQAAREALPVTEAMVGKVCSQTDTSPASFWLLVRVTGGVSWMQIGAQGMTSGQAADLANALAKAQALATQTYLVKELTNELSSELAVEGANGLTIDYSTPGKAIFRAPNPPPDASSKADKDFTINAQTGTAYTLALSDDGRLVTMTNAAANQVTLPSNAAVALPIGAAVTVAQLGAGSTSIVAGSGATLLGVGTINQLNASLTFIKIATNTWWQATGPAPLSLTSSAPAAVTKAMAAIGTATDVARSDHKHDVSTAAPVALGAANAEGSSTSLARADHVHDASSKADKLYTIIQNAAASLTLNATHLNALIVCTYNTGQPQVVIPRDSTLNLPVGFNVTVMFGVISENVVEIVSEVASGTFGIPARYAQPYSSTATSPYRVYAPSFQIMTLVKIAADTWVITGHARS